MIETPFTHLNEDVETDYQTLLARAKECVHALFAIESEIFAFTSNNGAIVPAHPEWPKSGPDRVQVFLRTDH